MTRQVDGVDRALARYRQIDAAVKIHRHVAQRILDGGEDDVSADPRRASGDRAALRGLPAIGGRGSLGGHIRGTRPDYLY